MLSGIPVLNHEEQQEAVDKIHQLMADGMSSGEAIAIIAQEIRESHKGKEQVHALFEEQDENEDNNANEYENVDENEHSDDDDGEYEN